MEKSKYKIIKIEKKYENLRLDKFLFSIFSNVNNVLIQKAIRNKDIILNNKSVKSANTILKQNDELGLTNFIVKIFSNPSQKVEKKSDLKFTDKEIEKIKNCIIYKDSNIIAINKPSGLAVQSGSKIEKSLNDYLQFLRFENQENPKLVHRLDKDTSGLIIIARNHEIAEKLAEYFKNKDEKLDKIYLTLAVGKFLNTEGKIEFPLIKKVENGVEKVYKDEKNGKEATTIYKVLGYSEKYNVSLLEVKILTGRTHQIRVHLKEIGHPILGDGKYGGKKAFVGGLSEKIHLHSYKINIKNLDGKDLNLKADLPENFRKSLNILRLNNL